MSDLDKKLDEVLRECAGDWYYDGMVDDPTEDIDNCAEHIKQAFIDEGWTEPISDKQREDLVAQYAAAEFMKPTRVTGQEWYDRFSTALVGYACLPVDAGSVDWDSGDVMRAAKKASGLES